VDYLPKVAAIAVVAALATGPAFAGSKDHGKSWKKSFSFKKIKTFNPKDCIPVPEIDAASGMAAIAAIGACLALARDRRNKAA
jgi:hypothetical protein